MLEPSLFPWRCRNNGVCFALSGPDVVVLSEPARVFVAYMSLFIWLISNSNKTGVSEVGIMFPRLHYV